MRAILSLLAVLFVVTASASKRPIRVTGTVVNIQAWEIHGYYTAVLVRGGPMPQRGALQRYPGVTVDLKTGHFEGEIPTEVIRNAHGRWVDLHVVAISTLDIPPRQMVIRVPYAHRIDLGTFDWKSSHYLWKNGTLAINTAVPRDTLIGEPWGNHVIISPINPTPQDSVALEFVWASSGAPFEAAWSALYKEHWTLIDITFALRTDVDVYTEGWMQRATPIKLGSLTAGCYGIRQVPAQGEQLSDVDFLLGRIIQFTVTERFEP
jgi:hypothetical protein